MRSILRKPRVRLAGWILATIACGSLLSAAATTPSKPLPGPFALDQAFRFATAIDVDPKDQARAQSIVIGDYLTVGAIDRAASQADQVQGWRRGMAYADIAASYARAGETERAREWIEKAESFRRTIEGWENPRIAAQVALALAQSGEIDRARQLVVGLVEADPRQYAGMATAVEAVALGASGDFDAGRKALEAAADATDFEQTWWRTRGYLELARSASFSLDQRLQAIEAARISAEGVAGWRKIEALCELARDLADLDRSDLAVEFLKSADAAVLPIAPELAERASLMAMLGQAWARLGDGDRAAERLRGAAAGIDNAMDIEQPGMLASVAAGYALLGDSEQAERGFDAALSSAESLENARPRALALVAICRQIGLAELSVNSARAERIQALREGLRAPW